MLLHINLKQLHFVVVPQSCVCLSICEDDQFPYISVPLLVFIYCNVLGIVKFHEKFIYIQTYTGRSLRNMNVLLRIKVLNFILYSDLNDYS